MPKRQHPELEGYESQPLYTFELKNQRKTRRDRLLLVSFGLLVGLGVGIGFHFLEPGTWKIGPVSLKAASPPTDEQFQQGFRNAMRAAELTQIAEYREEWVTVAMLWQTAITHMEAVQKSSSQYETAQQKVTEYQRNLQYAQSNVQTRKSSTPQVRQFWTLGSDREMVIAVQGAPTQVLRYDSLCQEVLRYDRSQIKLQHGYVLEYDNLDNNLKVLVDGTTALSTQGTGNTWTIGSTREEIFRFQGAPTRINGYEASGSETLYYGNSFIELNDGRAAGYHDIDNNLNVTMAQPSTNAEVPTWTLGSSRAEVLRAQNQAPSNVNRKNNVCEEIFYYGESSVSLKHGLVTGYSNTGNNLNVR